MVIIEEKHDQKSEWHSHKYPFHIQNPEINKPASRLCWVESSADRQCADTSRFQSSRYVNKPRPEEGAQLAHTRQDN